MIGILIDDYMEGYILSNKIIEKIKTTIYITKENNIDKLIDKKCKIIISKSIENTITDKFKNTIFIQLNDLSKNYKVYDYKELLSAIRKGNIKEVNKLLNNISTINDNILVNNISLLLIEEKLKEKLRNMETITNLLIDSIEQIIKNNKINLIEKEECIIIN